MAELRDVLTAGLWGRVSIAIGDVVCQSDWFGRRSNLPSEVADRDHGDFCLVDVPDPGRPDQYAAVGNPADGAVLFRDWDVRDDASERESIWCRRCHKRLSEETVRRIWPEVVFWAV